MVSLLSLSRVGAGLLGTAERTAYDGLSLREIESLPAVRDLLRELFVSQVDTPH